MVAFYHVPRNVIEQREREKEREIGGEREGGGELGEGVKRERGRAKMKY